MLRLHLYIIHSYTLFNNSRVNKLTKLFNYYIHNKIYVCHTLERWTKYK